MIGSHGETGCGSNRYVRRPSTPRAIVFSSSDDSPSAGSYGAGFRPSPFITPEDFKVSYQTLLVKCASDGDGEPSGRAVGLRDWTSRYDLHCSTLSLDAPRRLFQIRSTRPPAPSKSMSTGGWKVEPLLLILLNNMLNHECVR